MSTKNMTLKIDSETMDLTMDNDGNFELIYGDETTAQAVRLTLQAWEGDFPLDESHGTAWKQILGRKFSDLGNDEAAEVIRKAIFQEDQVQQVNTLTIEQSGTRSFDIAFSGTLYSGRTISTEVSI